MVAMLMATIAQASPNLGGTASPIQRSLDDAQRVGAPNFFQQGRDRFEAEIQQLNRARPTDLLQTRPALRSNLQPPHNVLTPDPKRF